MFEKFGDAFSITERTYVEDIRKEFYKGIPLQAFELIDSFGGCSFNNGLYKIHSFSSSIKWAMIITEFFADYESLITPFGFDWMGRQFCVNTNNPNLIYMFDAETAEAFELEVNLPTFHNDELVSDMDSMISNDMFTEVLGLNEVNRIGYDECFSFKIPLFLNGSDELINYEKTNLEVYWSFQSQIYKQIKDLPPGTKLNIKLG